MYRLRPHGTKLRRGMRVEPLESRTLFHAGTFAMVDRVIDLTTVHAGNSLLVKLVPGSQSIEVFNNGEEVLHVAATAVRGLNLRGLAGNDVAMIDARLRLPVRYEPGVGKDVVRTQLGGIGSEGDEYYIARPGQQGFEVACLSNAHSITRLAPSGQALESTPADAIVTRSLVGMHVQHGMSSPNYGSGMNGDGAYELPDGVGMSLMTHGPNDDGSASFSSMVTMDYAVKRGALPKWMPPG